MWEKLKKKAAAAIPKVTKAVKAASDTAKKAGKAVKETRLGKLASKAGAAVPACVKSIGRTTSKVRAAVPKYVDAARQKAVAIAAVNAAAVTVKKREVKQLAAKAAGPALMPVLWTETVAKETVNQAFWQAGRSLVEFHKDIPEKNQNIWKRVQEEIELYRQEAVRGVTRKGVVYSQPHDVWDGVDLLLQMRKAVLEEYPNLAWKEKVLTSVHQTIRNGIIKEGDNFGNFVYNKDIPILSDFAAGLFNASDRGKGDYSAASTIGGAVNGVLAGGVLGLVDGVAGMTADPAEAIENINYIFRYPEESIPAILQGIASYFDDNFVSGNPEDRARAIGTMGFEAVFSIATAGNSAVAKAGDKAADGGNLAKGAKKASNMASAVDKTVEVGRLTNAMNRMSEFVVLGKGVEKIDDIMAAMRIQLKAMGTSLIPAMVGLDKAGDAESISKLYNDLVKKVEVKQGGKGVKITKTTDAADAVEDIGDAGKGTGVEGGSGASILDDTGKFADDVLENNYQKYVERNQKAGKPVRDRIDWKEASDYWTKESPIARGNKFNQTVRDSDTYPYHEVHLSNGKQLDSYDPVSGEIISRKATDLDKISEKTYRNYLSEIKEKYSVGTTIRSDKYPDLDGLKLEGDYILEVPASNADLSNIKYYEDIAEEYGVKLRFTEEIQ